MSQQNQMSPEIKKRVLVLKNRFFEALEAGDHELAKSDLTAVRAAYEGFDHGTADLLEAILLMKQGQANKAREYYIIGLQRAVSQTDCIGCMGELASLAKMFNAVPDACDTLGLAMEGRFSSQPELYKRVAPIYLSLLFENEDFAVAAEVAQNLLTIDPKSLVAHFTLARVAFEMGENGNIKEVVKAYQNAFAINQKETAKEVTRQLVVRYAKISDVPRRFKRWKEAFPFVSQKIPVFMAGTVFLKSEDLNPLAVILSVLDSTIATAE
jgi:tetratricopeptide (TPR) repeat protein